MPYPDPSTQSQPQTDRLKGQFAAKFLGVNLRRERMKLEDYDMAKAINADFHTQLGSFQVRPGQTKQFSTALSSTMTRRLGKVSGIRYRAAGTSWFREQTSIVTGLSGGNIQSIVGYRPQNDPGTWAFLADAATMHKDNGVTTTNWGIATPTNAPSLSVGAPGTLSGAYSVRYTYARYVGASLAHESSPSEASSTVTLAKQNGVVTWTASTDTQVTHVRIYRTQVGGSEWLFDQVVAIGTTIAVTSQSDTNLGAAVEFDNDPPPSCGHAALFQELVVLCRDPAFPTYLYASKRFRPESFPPDQFLDIGTAADPLQCSVPLAGILGVFSRLTKYRVSGNTISGFQAQECISSRGTSCPLTAIPTEIGCMFLAKDGVFLTNFMSADEGFADEILPLFFGETVNDMLPINWANAELTATAEYYKGRVYISYPSGSSTYPDTVMVYSRDTKKWYFYQYANPLGPLYYEEDVDVMTGGDNTGFVYTIEDGTQVNDSEVGAGVAMTVETKDYYGLAPNHKKFFQYFRVDADCGTGTLTAAFYVDGVLVTTASVTGSRTKRLLRISQGGIGYQWRVTFSYTGTQRVKVYGTEAVWLPLGAS